MTLKSLSPQRRVTGSLALAAMALPGVWSSAAQAQSPPEKGLIGLKYLRYQDSQDGIDRITVDSPAAYVVLPLASKWAVEGSAVLDALSGATPREHSVVSGATMEDLRTAGDMKVTYFARRSAYSMGLSYSTENDYTSLSFSGNASFSSENNNTTVAVGFAHSNDTIEPVESIRGQRLKEDKATNEFLLALTQAMTARDLLQVNLTYSTGQGYYDDPYKFSIINGLQFYDTRPGERQQTALLTRWNHHFSALRSTLRSSYRYYLDSFGIQAHTWQFEWAQSITPSVVLTPSLRYYTQRAADFYSDPDPNNAALSVPPNQQFYSTDQRLAAFGAFTFGLKADLRLGAGWAIDLKSELYLQNSSYRIGGSGSPGLEPMDATFLQFGISRTF